MKFTYRIACLASSSAVALFAAQAAFATDFNVPGGDLRSALDSYKSQSGVSLFVLTESVKGIHTAGVKGELSPDAALSKILHGTGFTVHRDPSGVVAVVREQSSQQLEGLPAMRFAQTAPPPRAAVETVTVTSSKLGGGDVQSIPISITALSQEQLTASQTNGGPDLIKQVPNMTFSKTNFTGYNIQIRGIGTQAISVTTDPAVAVAMNDIPFIRNHFFEQEFYDIGQVQVLRGPQGTLYGRNATAGVVNITTAKPTDQFEAMASGEIGNYHQRRFEGMLNLPLVDDRLDLRVAGEWTKRQGYSFNTVSDSRIDGRNLWSGRVSLGIKPVENLQMYLVWEHFAENDDRMRTAKQLCKTDPGKQSVNGVTVPSGDIAGGGLSQAFSLHSGYLSQSCLPASLYAAESFEVPYGPSLPYVTAGGVASVLRTANPYASAVQSRNLRQIETQIDPVYKAKNDTVELNIDYKLTPTLTFTSQTGFNQDFMRSTEDYNRFNTAPGIFLPLGNGLVDANGYFCDPQLGCSNRLVAQDLSEEHAWQLSQEFRLASNFTGPFNFSVGGNFMHYETEENYYVFVNTLTALAAKSGASYAIPWVPGVYDNHDCLKIGAQNVGSGSKGYQPNDPVLGAGQPTSVCMYVDPNPIGSLNNKGHNYFLSQNPYLLSSYALFGEAYYNIRDDLKLISGLRWTEDQKHFTNFPSELVANGWGYASTGVVDQQWDQFTGRAAVNWTPKLDFTDQTLIYASYAHGYKAGGANPPGANLYSYYNISFGGGGGSGGVAAVPIHPLTFKPEFIDAFELGSKNTLLDGALTFNVSAFYYDYKNYQISEIVDRTSINLNFNAKVKGAEIEAAWEPMPGLRFNFAGGWEDTSLAKGSNSVDLMDRTAGHSDWLLMKPFVTQSSNCILPAYVIAAAMVAYDGYGQGNPVVSLCGFAYADHVDPLTGLPYDPEHPRLTLADIGQGNVYAGIEPGSAIPADYPGFNPASAPNNGAGFSKDVSGNELPNAPPFTVSFGAQYSVPLTSDWAGTLRADYYWQDYSWARVFNDRPYDRLRGYTNVNLTLILTNQDGWQVMLYDKNVFNTTAITGAFLNSDDSGLTTNVFLTDPKLIGIRVTKNW